LLQKQYTALKAQFDIRTAKIDAFGVTVASNNVEIVRLKALVLELQTRLMQADDTIVKLRTENAELRSQLETALSDCAASNARELKLKAELSQMDQKLTKLTARLHSLIDQMRPISPSSASQPTGGAAHASFEPREFSIKHLLHFLCPELPEVNFSANIASEPVNQADASRQRKSYRRTLFNLFMGVANCTEPANPANAFQEVFQHPAFADMMGDAMFAALSTPAVCFKAISTIIDELILNSKSEIGVSYPADIGVDDTHTATISAYNLHRLHASTFDFRTLGKQSPLIEMFFKSVSTVLARWGRQRSVT
jgi:small-conductance mechanosensitive channel